MARAFLLLMLATHQALAQRTCSSTTSLCIRGGGSDSLHRYAPSDAESQTIGACCKACVAAPKCLAFQLVTKKGKHTECWLMTVTAYKQDSGESCVSGTVSKPSPPNKRANHSQYPGVWMQVQCIASRAQTKT